MHLQTQIIVGRNQDFSLIFLQKEKFLCLQKTIRLNITLAKDLPTSFYFKFLNKEWELEKETKVNQDFLLIKSSGILFIFLHAFYLIIWLMTHQRNF